MKRITCFLFICFSITIFSCENRESEVQKEYIKNLEEKNKILENELKEEKNKPPIVVERIRESDNLNRQDYNSMNNSSIKFFSIGSTEDEVIEVMGDPSSVLNVGLGFKRYEYDMSSITFKDGKVESYNNISKNLKVKIKK